MLVLLLADSETVTGILREAAVEGLMSWWGEGLRFMEALCRVEASSRAGEGIVGFCLGWGGWGERGGGCEWLEVVCSVCLAPWLASLTTSSRIRFTSIRVARMGIKLTYMRCILHLM